MKNSKYLNVARSFVVTSVLAFVGPMLSANGQTSLYFPSPIGTNFQNYAVQSVGVSPVSLNNKLFYAYQANTPNVHPNQVCIVGYAGPGPAACPDESNSNFPRVDGVPQAAVYNGTMYLAFAALGTHQLVIAKSTDGANFSFNEPAGMVVGVSPAIAFLNGVMYVAYQENNSAHYLGIAKSTDGGVTFTSQISAVYRIGHAPGMTYFNGQLVIAAFCQCDSHYLDVYTTTGSLTPTFATEDTSKTLANASQPSLAVYNTVLLLGYMQNGQRYFQTSTSYDAIHWTTAYRQTGLTNGWNGLGLTIVGNQIYGVYESQSAISGDPNSAANEFAYSITSGVQ